MEVNEVSNYSIYDYINESKSFEEIIEEENMTMKRGEPSYDYNYAYGDEDYVYQYPDDGKDDDAFHPELVHEQYYATKDYDPTVEDRNDNEEAKDKKEEIDVVENEVYPKDSPYTSEDKDSSAGSFYGSSVVLALNLCVVFGLNSR